MSKNALNCFFVTDLHGNKSRYQKLFDHVVAEQPKALFIGGDILPHAMLAFNEDTEDSFISDYLIPKFHQIKIQLKENYPEVFVILGNDDPRIEEQYLMDGEQAGLWHYINQKQLEFEGYNIYGYAFIPPSPFMLKDWEKYDVSRYLEPGCLSPEEGGRSVSVEISQIKYGTIKKDLVELVGEDDLSRAVFLFHAPPYKCALDRAALDGKFVDHVPLDVHIGSIAIKEMIEERQPYLTLHGHVHESFRLTGSWRENFGQTISINAAHDGPELALVRFDLNNLTSATREQL